MTRIVCSLVFLFGLFSEAGQEKPNIIIIMTDDMGFSDLGCYGGEINTPHLDKLAQQGLRFTQFYNTGRCCPTRASLLTGLYAHQAGMGGMTGDSGAEFPGYRGRLMQNAVTIAEVLKPAGYRTIHTGKWHVGDKKKQWWPHNRGFERTYSCPQGGGFYFRPSSFAQKRFVVRGDKILYDQQDDPPKDWYATDAWTDEGLKYVEEAVKDKKRFFWYLAHNAPHFPLQAKPEDIAKYRGKYKGGWDQLRRQRYEKLKRLGIIKAEWALPARDAKVPAWLALSEKQKDQQDLRMATYAAMIDCVDQNVGKIVDKLKQLGVYENTLIVFLQDNGAADSGGNLGSNKAKGICGTAESFAYYGKCWANVSNTPLQQYKMWCHEGGISTPLIAHWPKGISQKLEGQLVRTPAHVIDLMATCVDLGSASYPQNFKGHQITALAGLSLEPLFHGEQFPERPLFFEHYGNRAVRSGKWKLVSVNKSKTWQLFDMHKDRTETQNIADQFPEKVQALKKSYQNWSKKCHVR